MATAAHKTALGKYAKMSECLPAPKSQSLMGMSQAVQKCWLGSLSLNCKLPAPNLGKAVNMTINALIMCLKSVFL